MWQMPSSTAPTVSMLSGESAMGKYPVDAVAMLAGIASVVEPHRPQETARNLFEGIELKGKLKPRGLVAVAVAASTKLSSPAAVFVPTHSGETARALSLFRLPVWIAAVCSSEQACRNLLFSYGVHPVTEATHPEDWDSFVRSWLEKHELTGDVAILTEGPSAKHPEAHNRMDDHRPETAVGEVMRERGTFRSCRKIRYLHQANLHHKKRGRKNDYA